MVSKEEVKKIYDLANLKVSEDELLSLSKKFEDVFNFANEIMKLDTTDCEDLEIVVEHSSPLRDDVIGMSVPREDALMNVKDREFGYFRVKRVVE